MLLDEVSPQGVETVAYLLAVEGVERLVALQVVEDDPEGGRGVDFVAAWGTRGAGEGHAAVARVGVGAGGDGLAVVYVGVELRGEGFGGVEGAVHDAHEGLVAEGVAGREHKVGDGGTVDVIGADPCDAAEVDGVEVRVVVEVRLWSLAGDEPLVARQARRGPQGVDGRRGAFRTACRDEARRGVVAGNVGVERVYTPDAIARVYLHTYVLADILAEVHGALVPRLVDIVAGPGVVRRACTPGFGKITCDVRRRYLVPQAVVDGFVGPFARAVPAHHAHQELPGIVGRVVVAPRHNGEVQYQQRVVVRHPHGVEERLGAVGMGSLDGLVQRVHLHPLDTVHHASQADGGLVALRDALHPHAVVQRELVDARLVLGVDVEAEATGVTPVVAAGIREDVQRVVAADADAAYHTVAHQVRAEGAGTHHVVARGGVVKDAVLYHPRPHTCAPVVERVAGVETSCVAQLGLGEAVGRKEKQESQEYHSPLFFLERGSGGEALFISLVSHFSTQKCDGSRAGMPSGGCL